LLVKLAYNGANFAGPQSAEPQALGAERLKNKKRFRRKVRLSALNRRRGSLREKKRERRTG